MNCDDGEDSGEGIREPYGDHRIFPLARAVFFLFDGTLSPRAGNIELSSAFFKKSLMSRGRAYYKMPLWGERPEERMMVTMSQGSEGLWEKLSRLSPHIEAITVLQTLRQLDREFEHLPPDQRLLFLAEALRQRNLCSSFQGGLEIATLWMDSNLRDHAGPDAVMETAGTSRDRPKDVERAMASPTPAFGVAVSPKREENEQASSIEGREALIRELIRMLIGQIESSCGWGERELVSVERDGVMQILDLLRLLRAEPELFEYAIERLRELLNRLEAERKAHVRKIRQEAETGREPPCGEMET